MARPLNREQRLQNQAFVKALAQGGNVREAAREIGVHYGTIQHRRRAHPVFAAEWDAALLVAQARLAKAGGAKRPSGAGKAAVSARAKGAPSEHRTQGGEAVVVQRRDGTLQLRRAQPGKLTRECEQAFLAALSATCNVRLSAAAAGAAEAAFYRRKRRHPGFAREWQLALEQGYEALEMALIAGFEPDAALDDAWRHNEPPPVPMMTPNQALQLLYLHHKTAKLWAEAPHMKRRTGETSDEWAERRGRDYVAGKARIAERLQIADTNRALKKALDQVERRMARKPKLPALDQVTGWSKADPDKVPHDETRALFGGWRKLPGREG